MEHTTRFCDILKETMFDGQDAIFSVNKLDEDGDVEWGYTQHVDVLWAQLAGRNFWSEEAQASFFQNVKRLEEHPGTIRTSPGSASSKLTFEALAARDAPQTHPFAALWYTRLR